MITEETIRQKVESGEPLTTEEIRWLRSEMRRLQSSSYFAPSDQTANMEKTYQTYRNWLEEQWR